MFSYFILKSVRFTKFVKMQDLRFRTFTGEVFELPANPAQTIGDLIITLQETINDPNYTNIILILNGNTLNPSDGVSSIGNIADDEYILVKNSKRRAKAKKENTTPAPEEKKTTFAEEEKDKPDGIKEQVAPSSEPVHRRPRRPLPRRTDLEIPDKDPPDFEQKVQILMELGDKSMPFKREDVEKALRVSFFNPDRASLYLFSGSIPDYPEPEVNSRLRKQSNTKDSKQDSNQTENKSDEANKPDQLTEEQKNLIMLVMRDTGKDYGTVLQTAYACKFNENDLRNCLLQD